MNKTVISSAKWAAIGLLMAFNFFFYLLNEDKTNLVLAVVIIFYSFYEFFHSIKGRQIKNGMKLYLFTFYTLAVLSLFMGVRNFVVGNTSSTIIGFILMAGDIALIVYTVYRLTHPERYQ